MDFSRYLVGSCLGPNFFNQNSYYAHTKNLNFFFQDVFLLTFKKDFEKIKHFSDINCITSHLLAKLAGAVEYTDCISPAG